MMIRSQCACILALLAGMLLTGCSGRTPPQQPEQFLDQMEENVESQSPPPEYEPHASFDEDEVAYPRLEVYVVPDGTYYCISVEPSLADSISTSLAEGTALEPEAVYTADCTRPQIAYVSEAGSWDLLTQTSSGEFILGHTPLPVDTGKALIRRAEEATGWKLENDFPELEKITEIGVCFNGECLYTIVDADRIAAFETFLHHGIYATEVPKTPEYFIEIRCQLQNGESISLVSSPYGDLWLPPCFFYGSSDSDQALLTALGLDNWPSPIMEQYEEAWPFSDMFFSELYDRTGGRLEP